jgi:hypothetical protein
MKPPETQQVTILAGAIQKGAAVWCRRTFKFITTCGRDAAGLTHCPKQNPAGERRTLQPRARAITWLAFMVCC